MSRCPFGRNKCVFLKNDFGLLLNLLQNHKVTRKLLSLSPSYTHTPAHMQIKETHTKAPRLDYQLGKASPGTSDPPAAQTNSSFILFEFVGHRLIYCKSKEFVLLKYDII